MPDQKPNWREALMDAVDTRPTKKERRSIAINFSDSWYVMIQRAAKARGMSMTAFMRRAVMAFVVFDLGEDWFEVMEGEPNIGPYANSYGTKVLERKAGHEHGDWQIEGLS
jgi:hypothetical protein